MNVLLTEIRTLSQDPPELTGAAGDGAGEFTRLLHRELQGAGAEQFQGIEFKGIYSSFERVAGAVEVAPAGAWRDFVAPDAERASGSETPPEPLAAPPPQSTQPPLPAALPVTGEALPPGGISLPQAMTRPSPPEPLLSAAMTPLAPQLQPAASAPLVTAPLAPPSQAAALPAIAVADSIAVAAPGMSAARSIAPGAASMAAAPAAAGTRIADPGQRPVAAASPLPASTAAEAPVAASPTRPGAVAAAAEQAAMGPLVSDRRAGAGAVPTIPVSAPPAGRIRATAAAPQASAQRPPAAGASARAAPATATAVPAAADPAVPVPGPQLSADAGAARASVAQIQPPARAAAAPENLTASAVRAASDAAVTHHLATPATAPASAAEAREPGAAMMPQPQKSTTEGVPPEAITARSAETPVNAAPTPQSAPATPAAAAPAPANSIATTPPHTPALQLEPMTLSRQADSGEWGNGLGERVQYLINQKHNSATIRLDPPALGKLDVQVRISDDATTITIHTQHAQTRELIDSASYRLREFLQENGYQNVNVDVSQRQDQQQPRGQAAQGDDGRQADDERAQQDAAAASQSRQHEILQGDGLLDTFA